MPKAEEEAIVMDVVEKEVDLAARRLAEWRGTYDDINDVVNILIRAANRIAPEGHRCPEPS